MNNEEIIKSFYENTFQTLGTDSYTFRCIKLEDINCIFDVNKIGSYECFKN